MDARELFAVSVLVYAGIPLLIALAPVRQRIAMSYVYLASVLTLGGILGAVYVLPLGGDVSLLAGQISYGAFLFATLVAVVVGRDVRIVRDIIWLVITVNTVVLAVFRISQHALEDSAVLNVFGTPAAVFEKSVDSVLLGGVLIIVELVLLLGVLELAKARFGTTQMVPVYLLSYVGALTLDGLLFPVLVLRPETGLGALVQDQVLAKLVLAVAFSVPLLLFVLAYRPAMRSFESAPLNLRHLLVVTRDELLEQIDVQQSELAAQRDRLLLRDHEVVAATATVSSILEAATDTLLMALDPQLRITAFNAGAELILARPRDSVVGLSPATFHTPAEIARHALALGVEPDFDSVLHAQVTAGERRDWEFVVGDDERLVISLSITEIEVDGLLVGYVVAGVDITQRLGTEQALQSALANEHEALVRLRETDSFKRTVVSTVSHELRTPIASILGYTELMVEGDFGDLTEEQRGAVDKVRHNASRLTLIVDDLLMLDQTETLLPHLALEDLDLCEVVRECFEHAPQLLVGHDHEVVVDLPDQPVRVAADPAGLHRVLSNLIGNAGKFTPEPATITVRVTVRGVQGGGSEACLSVSDTGIGIEEHDLARLFERFYRASSATSRAIPGSGLGLSIVETVVAHHGGRMEVESTVGQGTTMTAVLPLVTDAP